MDLWRVTNRVYHHINSHFECARQRSACHWFIFKLVRSTDNKTVDCVNYDVATLSIVNDIDQTQSIWPSKLVCFVRCSSVDCLLFFSLLILVSIVKSNCFSCVCVCVFLSLSSSQIVVLLRLVEIPTHVERRETRRWTIGKCVQSQVISCCSWVCRNTWNVNVLIWLR
jgi:hypothetical protein